MTEQEKRDAFRDVDWLRNALWRWEVYRPSSEAWNHEHCVFCSRRIATSGYGDPNALQEAWTTTFTHPEGDEGYEWVCPSCFDELRDTFAWGVEGQDTPAA